MTDDAGDVRNKGLLERLLSLMVEIRAGEAPRLLLMLANIFVIMAGYYLIKTAREPLILVTGGAEAKSYAAAVQAVVLIGFVPLYGWFASRVSRLRLIASVTVLWIVCLQLFFVGLLLQLPYLGFVFFVWVGLFGVSIPAQFWSYANDNYTQVDGERLFPMIVVGMTAGPPIGSFFGARLFDNLPSAVATPLILQLTAGMLALSLALFLASERLGADQPEAEATPKQALERQNGFLLVFKSPYIRLIALLLIILNLVNTTGEYILGKGVAGMAAAQALQVANFDQGAFIGAFYGNFFTVVNVVAILLQAFLVSRIVKRLGMAGVLFALPLVALGTYGLVLGGVGFAMFRWAKTAENSTDYSVMNTVKAMLWLPTTRVEKYNAKQAVDTFFVRMGDVLSAGLVFVGTTWLGFGMTSFAAVNVVLVVAWLGVALLVLRKYQALTAKQLSP